MMETNTTNKGMKTVRERAARASKVRLNKAEGEHCDLPRTSMQKMRTLKSLSAEAEREMEDLPHAGDGMFDKMWDWFQRSIGNR